MGFVLNMQVAISLIVFVRSNRYCLQTVKSVDRYEEAIRNSYFSLHLTLC